jgi:hypothetical protein
MRLRCGVQSLALAVPRVGIAWRQLQATGGVSSPFLVWELFSALADVPELSGGTQVLVVDVGAVRSGSFPWSRMDGPHGLPVLWTDQ